MQSSMIPAPPVVPPPLVETSITPPPIASGDADPSQHPIDATVADHRSRASMVIGIGLITAVVFLVALLPVTSSITRQASTVDGPERHQPPSAIPSVGVDLEFAPITVDQTGPLLDELEAEPSASTDQRVRSIPIESVSFQEIVAPKPMVVQQDVIPDDTSEPNPEIVEPPTIGPAPLLADAMKLETLGTLDLRKTFPAPPQCETGTCPSKMASHGTALEWADSLDEARLMAQSQKKLVFLIHISGNFEIPGFT